MGYSHCDDGCELDKVGLDSGRRTWRIQRTTSFEELVLVFLKLLRPSIEGMSTMQQFQRLMMRYGG